MFDAALLYDRLHDTLAADPTTVISELEAKAVALRWMTDFGGQMVWGSEPYHALWMWADDGYDFEDFAMSTVISLAVRLLDEITLPRLAERWTDFGGDVSHDAAVAAVDALVRYLTGEPFTYKGLVHRLAARGSADITLTYDEAKMIATAWATSSDYPHLEAWTNGRVVRLDALRAEAEQLADNLEMNRDSWPHEGAPRPSIAAAHLLTSYFEQND
ncbi:hypothetical protein [Nocardia sp. XZ_19_231]|uniref:hypothetical protein n=1 Tax=Nocardia sp. XZ_19_231 TaxID=2769252 RepID=UPI00189094DA|nr:hypothetical protein [Nocardia sp. XZ_19_231]